LANNATFDAKLADEPIHIAPLQSQAFTDPEAKADHAKAIVGRDSSNSRTNCWNSRFEDNIRIGKHFYFQ
jgi:hypothetical protein